MLIFTVILEIALIVALGAVWWMARRDLLMLVTRQQTPTLREIEHVQASIEQLLERLDAKTGEAERRVAALLPDARPAPNPVPGPAGVARESETLRPQPSLHEHHGALTLDGPDANSRYAEVYRLADAGLDAEEIARRTGLGSGEVRLVISLRPS